MPEYIAKGSPITFEHYKSVTRGALSDFSGIGIGDADTNSRRRIADKANPNRVRVLNNESATIPLGSVFILNGGPTGVLQEPQFGANFLTNIYGAKILCVNSYGDIAASDTGYADIITPYQPVMVAVSADSTYNTFTFGQVCGPVMYKPTSSYSSPYKGLTLNNGFGLISLSPPNLGIDYPFYAMLAMLAPGDFEYEGKLTSDLSAPVDSTSAAPTTATAEAYKIDTSSGTWIPPLTNAFKSVTIVNRNPTFAAADGTTIRWKAINWEWRITDVGC